MLLFLVAVFFAGFFTFIALLEGFQIDHLRFKGVAIEQLYLKWDNSLRIKIAKIDLTDMEKNDLPITLKPLAKLPSFIRIVENWIEYIEIKNILYNDLNASVSYAQGLPGHIVLHKGIYTCNGTFLLNPDTFDLSLPSCNFGDALLGGRLAVNLPQQQMSVEAALQLPDMPRINLTASGNSDTLTFSADADQNMTTVKPLVDFLGVEKDVQPWIVEYAKASSILLHSLSGKFHYDSPEELLNNLHAEATVRMGEYTFAQGFEPIKAPTVSLSFMHGKLYITPNKGTFYNLPTEHSRLYIDFTTPHTMLEAKIRTDHAVLNDSILSLLRFYQIDLPIKQTNGECAVDLNLSINLHSLETTAQGTFQPTLSTILLDQIALQSEGGIVRLDNTHVIFENFIARYGKDIATARVNGEYDASKDRGIVSIEAYDVSPIGNRGHLSLQDSNNPLRVTYLISPQGDTLDILPSKWNVLGETLRIEAFRAPFDYHRAYAAVKNVPFTLSNTAHGKINAFFNGSKKKTDVKIDVQDFRLGEIQLLNAPFAIDIHYDENRSILRSTNASSWSIHQLPLLISPFDATLVKDEITFDHIETVLGDILKGKFSGNYRLDTQKGSVRVSDMISLNPKVLPLVETKEPISLTVDASGNEIILDADTLKTRFSTISNGWKMSINDIRLLSRKSPLLRKYNIDNGYLNIFYTGASSRYTFNGEIEYPYALMMINDNPISHYRYSGTYQDGNTKVRVNDRIVISKTEKSIDVNAKNAGINMPQLFKFLSSHQPDEEKETSKAASDALPISIQASNTYLYLMKGRKIVADSMNATLLNNDMDATLQHMGGSAVLKIRNGLFYIDGNGFNDKFMEHLFALSDFSGGKFSFEAKGEAEAFDGLMRVEKTILKDYKVLNNVLAFVNTVPSLATFSLPNYNTQGLPVEEGYAHFAYEKGVLTVDNFTLNSDEIKIVGEGIADMKAQSLNGTLTLKTDLGSKLGKVPMVGYILFGDDGSISTTLTLTGKLDNPQVHTAIAKEIVTAPFNILKRTLVYPFLWMIPDDKKKK